MIRIFLICSGVFFWVSLLFFIVANGFAGSINKPKELKKINTALQADKRVSAYFLYWYEGATLSTNIWLGSDKYIKFAGFGAEALTSYAPEIRIIGPYTVMCSYKGWDGGIYHTGSLSLSVSESVKDLEVNSIFDVFSEYDTILERVSRLPEVADSSEKRLPNAAPLGTCSKKTTTQPTVDIPTSGIFLQDKGFSFYTK